MDLVSRGGNAGLCDKYMYMLYAFFISNMMGWIRIADASIWLTLFSCYLRFILVTTYVQATCNIIQLIKWFLSKQTNKLDWVNVTLKTNIFF